MLQSRFVKLVLCLLLSGGTLLFFPIFRIRPLASADPLLPKSNSEEILPGLADQPASAGQNAPAQATGALLETLWTQRLPEAAQRAATVNEFLDAVGTDAEAAFLQYGRRPGLGGQVFVFLAGRGRIVSVNDDECVLTLEDSKQRVLLEIGILLGNAVRDATGLISVNDFANSQDFNSLSAELNRRCEREVIDPVRNQLIAGTQVDFVGCGEVRGSVGDGPLRLIPVQLKVFDAKEPSE